jgi:hypothetical protein
MKNRRQESSKKTLALLFLCALCVFGVSGESHRFSAPVGAYLWGGFLGGRPGLAQFYDSVGFLLGKGFRSVRFTVSPASIADYGLSPDDCPGRNLSPCYLEKFLASSVFDDPKLHLLMITLHDFTSAAGSHIVDPQFLTQHRDAILQETEDDLSELGRRFKARRVSIVISNWEGDNLVYCAHTYQFAIDAAFHAECIARTGGDFAARLKGFQQWVDLRDEAIRRFQRESPGLDVIQAPEFSNLNIFTRDCRTGCDPNLTVFETLAKRPLCSYSAYDSSGRGTLDADLPRILTTCDHLIIGELGFDLKGNDTRALARNYDQAAKALLRFDDRLSGVFLWHAFENSKTNPGFALYDNDGRPAHVQFLPACLRPEP